LREKRKVTDVQTGPSQENYHSKKKDVRCGNKGVVQKVGGGGEGGSTKVWLESLGDLFTGILGQINISIPRGNRKRKGEDV